MSILLVTGGTGYIGSHCVVALLEKESVSEIIVVDNGYNSNVTSICKVFDGLNKQGKKLSYVNVDIADKEAVDKAFGNYDKIDEVIHFAALKSVNESCEQPLRYYRNNMQGLLNIIELSLAKGVTSFVFSSSATVYKPCEKLITEDSDIGASNPYGHTKVFAEQILQDVTKVNSMRVMSLRYFNPIGAHESGLLGDYPPEPKNLLPIIQRAVDGSYSKGPLQITGTDYPTPDGTGVRDYVHIDDLVIAHIDSLDYLRKTPDVRYEMLNIGTGRGYSVNEVVSAFEKASNVKVPTAIAPRRPGDIATVVADVTKAKHLMNFSARRGLDEACESAWKFQCEEKKRSSNENQM